MSKRKVNWFVIWVFGLFVCAMLEVPFWGMALLSLGYVAFIVLLQLHLCLFWLGYFLHGLWRKQETALKLYEYAYSHGARAGTPMIAYAMLLMNQGQYAQGLEVLREVQGRTDVNPRLQLISRQDLAIALEKNGDVLSAIEEMEKILEEYETMDSNFYSTLSYFYIQAGDFEKAKEVNELSRTDREKGAYYDNLALIAYRQEDYAAAKTLFEKALEIDSEMLSPQFYLGLLAEADGDDVAAAEYFRNVRNGGITGLSTISREDAEEKYRRYWGEEDAYENRLV